MTEALLDRNKTVDPKLDDGTGDHDRFAHYFKKADFDKAWLDGEPIKALCGKKDIPQRNPADYSVCPTCKEIFESIPEGPKGE